MNPIISFTGSPITDSLLYFYDANGKFYTDIVEIIFDFGDGSLTSASYDSTTVFPHTYTIADTYTVSLSAIDSIGNINLNRINLPIFQNELSVEKDDLIHLTGPSFPPRYGPNKLINLINFLPEVLLGTQTEQFLVVFENFLNNMFDGLDGYSLNAQEIDINKNVLSASPNYINNYSYNLSDGLSATTNATTAEQINIGWPSQIYKDNPKISILEKIKRITELQDYDLIDKNYIQYFAKNLGYDIDIKRNEVAGNLFGNLSTLETDTETNSDPIVDQEKYLRFVVETLPNFYKIKSTRNAIKVMLYSFGLISDIVEYYTKDYDKYDYSKWSVDYDHNLNIKDDYYPAPHFGALINIDKSVNISFDISKTNSIINAIESIRPVNTTFHGLHGLLTRILPTIYVQAKTRLGRYIQLNNSIPSDYFRNHNSSGNSGNLYGR